MSWHTKFTEARQNKYWANRLAEVGLDNVVLVYDCEEQPCGHWAVVVVLGSGHEIIADGTLDDWWYKNDKDLRERIAYHAKA